MNDVRRMIYGSLILFFMTLGFWFSVIYISSCGFTLTCNQARHIVIRTPVPTLIPVSGANPQPGEGMTEFDKCLVGATDLIGAWVSAGHPETEAFPFSDVNGQPCEGTFTENVQPLFVENSIWYEGSIGCISCHNPDQPDRNAGLDLTSYEAMSSGPDIFSGDDPQNSLLYDVLVNRKLVPEGHSADNPGDPVFVYAGHVISDAAVTATPTP
jgi:Planctomycete cytochrome C